MSEPQDMQAETTGQEIPGTLPVLPLRDTVVFPDTMIPLTIGQERSIKLIDDVLAGDRLLALVTSRDAEVEVPGPDLLYPIGTVGLAHKMIKLPDGTMRILVQGLQRVRLDRYVQEEPYLTADISKVEDVVVKSQEVEALRASLLSVFSKIVALVPYLPEELEMAAANVEEPGPLTFLVASTMRIKSEDKQALLAEDDVEKRLRMLIGILTRELDVLELGSKIQSDVRSEIDKGQREYFLRQQMRAIQQELGETNEQEAEITELRTKIEELKLPEEVDKAARRELERLANISAQSAEYPVIRTYLDWIITLPWAVSSEDNLDVPHGREILERDHYDLEKVKDRILEFLAVRKLKADLHGPILCFVGPPGVGKTSLGHSIAEAMGRKFERISVGGVRDEAEIRGHRRTYVGAMPGIIVRAMRDAGTNNPLFMIDEIDKTGADWRGDPASALLEVLDPEQNVTFRDHYMDLPFDLSKVLFITTANQLEPIPAPLRDRMEIITLAGYTIEEKLHIARNYLVPRQIEANGLKAKQVTFVDAAIVEIISSYTREAGVRNLEREIGTVCRKIAREVAEATNGGRKRFTVNVKRIHELLGRPRMVAEVKRRTSDPGVATGLAWTPVGGDILFIEATAMPGNGRPHRHRSARRRDERVGHGRHELRAHALARARSGGRLLPEARHPRARAGRRHPQRRPFGRRDDGHGDLLAGHRHAGEQRGGHDRRGYAHRPGAAHRRPQGEDPGRAARRHHHGDPAEPQRGRSGRRAGRAAQGHALRAGRARRAGVAGGHGVQARRQGRRAGRGQRAARRGQRAPADCAPQGAPPGTRGERIGAAGADRSEPRRAGEPPPRRPARSWVARRRLKRRSRHHPGRRRSPAPGPRLNPRRPPRAPAGVRRRRRRRRAAPRSPLPPAAVAGAASSPSAALASRASAARSQSPYPGASSFATCAACASQSSQ